MNIFILSTDPVEAAKMQCNAHIVKMVIESAQMLSTAHRVLDGRPEKHPSKSGKRLINKYIHQTKELDDVLYGAVHQNHPCTKWTMVSNNNYTWHYIHFIALCDEYTHRYGKIHGTDSRLREVLRTPPRNIPIAPKTQFCLAMHSRPECMFPHDPVKSYRMFYQTKQERFNMVWSKREVPDWFQVKVG